MASTSNNAPSTARTNTAPPSTQQPPSGRLDNTAKRVKPGKQAGGSSRRKTVKMNSSRRKNVVPGPGGSQNHSIDNSPEATPRNSNSKPVNVPDSPRSRVPFCKNCNYRADKKGGNFLKNVLKKTITALRASDTLNRARGDLVSDAVPEYSAKPGSSDMLPIPRFTPPFPGFEQEILKNHIPPGGVFEEKRPWWSFKKEGEKEAPIPYQPISKIALDLCYEKDPSVFTKPPGRKTFYDPVTEDLDTLKALDTVHNCENRVICNTFFSGIYVLDAKTADKKKPSKESNSDDLPLKNKRDSDPDAPGKKKEKEKVKRDVTPEIMKIPQPVSHVKFADDPQFLHQYSRKDRNLTNEKTHRRKFIHAEYTVNRGAGAGKSTAPGKASKKGLVSD